MKNNQYMNYFCLWQCAYSLHGLLMFILLMKCCSLLCLNEAMTLAVSTVMVISSSLLRPLVHRDSDSEHINLNDVGKLCLMICFSISDNWCDPCFCVRLPEEPGRLTGISLFFYGTRVWHQKAWWFAQKSSYLDTLLLRSLNLHSVFCSESNGMCSKFSESIHYDVHILKFIQTVALMFNR